MKKILKFGSVFSFLFLSPFIAFAFESVNPPASACSGVPGLGGIICTIQQLLNSSISVLIALGVVYFVWGVVTYVIANEEEAKKAGRDRMIFGLIGLVVIIGLWGLVGILKNTFQLNNNSQIVPPTVNFTTPTQ